MNVVVSLLLILSFHLKFNCQVVAQNSSIIKVIYNNSEEFQRLIIKLLDVNLEIPAQLKNKAIHTVKAYTVVEPTLKETADADKALNEAFGLSSGFLPDSNESMDEFCDESARNERRKMIRNYVIRKYTTNLFCRLAFNMIETRVENRNDFYCGSTGERQVFIRHANEIKKYKNELDEIRRQFKLRLIDMQHTNLGAFKSKTFCCSFWRFRGQTLDVIKNQETKHFFENMFESYFHLMTQYFCFHMNVLGCNSYDPPMNVRDPEAEKLSVAMNLIRATDKVTSLVL